MRRLLPGIALSCAIFLLGDGALRAQVRPDAPPRQQLAEAREEGAAKLRAAASQYALVSLYLDEGRYEMVPSEFQKILDLGFAGKEETLVAQAAWQFAERLREARRYNQAHDIVDRTLSSVADVENQFSLHMLKGKIYQEQKLYQKAVEQYLIAKGLRE